MPPEPSQSNSQEFVMVELTPEEEHFIQMLEDMNKNTIWVNRTQKGIVPGTFDEIKIYYTDLEASHILESLVRKGMIRRIDNGILLLCPSCGNHETSVLKKCPSCGSNKLRQRNKIVHTPCDHWGTFDEFNGGNTITCPVCKISIETNKILDNTSGFSYSDPYYECQECGFSSNKVPSLFLCTKCKTKFNSNNAVLLEQTGYKILVDPVTEPKKIDPPRKPLSRNKSTKSMIAQLEEITQVKRKEKRSTLEDLILSDPEILIPKKETKILDTPEPENKVESKSVQVIEEEVETENDSHEQNIQEEPQEKETDSEVKAPEDKKEDSRDNTATKVLLVVEEQMHYNLIIESLEKSGETLDVTLVEDGSVVLKTLRRPFDLLIFDSELSTIDPVFVLDEIAKWKIKTPIILLDNGYLKGMPIGLNLVATIKRKQRDIEQITDLVSELF